MHNIMSRLVGISVLKPVLRQIENALRNRRKSLKNKNLRIMFFVNISEHTQYFRNRIFVIGSFLIENIINK